jgi:hypothetical protein
MPLQHHALQHHANNPAPNCDAAASKNSIDEMDNPVIGDRISRCDHSVVHFDTVGSISFNFRFLDSRS